MPNRTIYLPEDLDTASRQLGLNLSRLTQEAIARRLEDDPEAERAAGIQAAMRRVAELDLDWPPSYLDDSRDEADER